MVQSSCDLVRPRPVTEGERRTVAFLQPFIAQGWPVLRDVRTTGGRPVDHVVVSDAGVWVIGARRWSAAPHLRAGSLWVGRSPQDRELRAFCDDVAAVAAAVAPGVEVRGVLCVTGAPPVPPVLHLGGVAVVGLAHLAAHVMDAVPRHSPAELAAIAAPLAGPGRRLDAVEVGPTPRPRRRPLFRRT